ncbi:DNA-binding transcriptional regulator, MerR family [Modicisalibacter ilicicola DSM 19980]|uniref:DNA-binding transcriptional regulator, MerR family n=1 Tax=Modicisalibacter ilicicola DSM 19980 TaxID=1121942 RepID=A0A1M5DFV6_9GAMM|nr:MerR family transcriptional regulator [Halomonas ilicicola]SHF65867.1 DNA-binding transcriptional regulator, MerR family [Halomonas ilicicola DSM 19980]
MSDKAIDPACAPLYPIREVSRLTGVNSVTLRAWERRYGLIRPQRTPKGHRLYAQEDIERIELILQWLNRGVPVSQVHDLLEQPERIEVPTPEAGDWPCQREQLVMAVEALDLTRLETLYNQSLALYPVNTCLNELWQPAVTQLEERWSDQLGAALQRRLLESFLRTRIGTRLYHSNLASRGPQLMIAPLSEESGALWPLLFVLAAADAGYRSLLLDAPLAQGELALAVNRLRLSGLVLASGQAERTEQVRRQLPRLAEQLSVPVCLAGPVARIRAGELADSGVELLSDDLVQSVSRLRPLLNQ